MLIWGLFQGIIKDSRIVGMLVMNYIILHYIAISISFVITIINNSVTKCHLQIKQTKNDGKW